MSTIENSDPGRRQVLAWLVVDSLGKRAVFIDQARAEQYAATRRGVVYPLYR